MPSRARHPWRRRGLLTAATVLVLVTSGVGSAAARSTTAAHDPDHDQRIVPTTTDVTLITGDTVRVVTRRDGQPTVSLVAGPDGSVPQAAIQRVGDHVYVIPAVAIPLLTAKRLDQRLFDVTGLIAQRYDDAHRKTMPVLIDYGHGAAAATRATRTTVKHAKKTRTIARLGTAAFAASKRDATSVWRSITAGRDASGAPTRLAGGAERIDLNARVHAFVDPNVTQIGAPTAWAAGYDGSGTTVAVLDTGYDPTHPDLAGKVAKTANFSTNASVTDGNGHGTHVATTIAGSGAASGGDHGGVAPGASLWVAKVLDDSGYGEDAAVLAGMQWAVTNGADIVSMSLGGDASDGTDPLSRAVDELSGSSDTLFVIAAGNAGNGGDASTVTSPGAAEAALTVGAVDGTDTMAWFSSRGPRAVDHAVKPDVVAPGVDIVAGRAAGTSLGSPIDDHYTSLSGTSMATPQVAALAAILKQEHPAWDGETLKAAITASTVPVPGATDYDAGAGRIDAARAIETTVVSDPSVELGFYAWPHDDLPVKRTAVSYRNLGSAAVTLELALAAEDGGPGPKGLSLPATTVTIPASASKTVQVALDPAAATVGASSAVITATPSDGAPTIRTAVGYELESEHYDLTLRLRDRPGTQRANHVIGLISYTTYSYDQRTVSDTGSSEVTFRVPPGPYSVADIGFQLAADGLVDGVLTYAPTVRVSKDTTVTLDGGAAKRFAYAVDKPVLDDGAILSVEWDLGDGFSGATLAGTVDRLFATPTAHPGSGFADASVDWLLSQPDAELALDKGTVPLRAVAAPGQRPWDVAVPAAAAHARIVDAGTVGALSATGVRGAIALVASPCADLGTAASTLADAGAVAMVAVPAAGASCSGTVLAPTALPTFSARPTAIAALQAARSKKATLVSHGSPSYSYRLAGWWPDEIPAGAVIDGHDGHVAAIVEHYDTIGGTSTDGIRVEDMFIGWMPDRDAAAYGLVRPVAIPGTVTTYVSPGPRWERAVQVGDAQGLPLAQLWASRVSVTAGGTTEDTWFGGPISSGVSPYLADLSPDAIPNRQGDSLSLYMPQWTDAAGHAGSLIYLDEFWGTLSQDGELLMEADSPNWMWMDVPAAEHEYRLTYHTQRENPFWRRSTSTDTAWRFTSAHADALTTLPLLVVSVDAGLDEANTAKAGPTSLDVGFAMPPGAATSRLKAATVELSWDGGTTWTATTARCADAHGQPRSLPFGLASSTTIPGGQCTVKVTNPTGKRASLRIGATDTAGRSVQQTIIDAYLVR